MGPTIRRVGMSPYGLLEASGIRKPRKKARCWTRYFGHTTLLQTNPRANPETIRQVLLFIQNYQQSKTTLEKTRAETSLRSVL